MSIPAGQLAIRVQGTAMNKHFLGDLQSGILDPGTVHRATGRLRDLDRLAWCVGLLAVAVTFAAITYRRKNS